MTSSIFLSHNFQDKEFVRRLADDLSRHEVKFWLDEAEINVGESLIEKIQQGISDMDYLGVVLSPDSVNSEWVKREVHAALNLEIRGRRIKVLPLLYKHCELPGFLIDKAYADFTDEAHYEFALSRLLKRLGVGVDSPLKQASTGGPDASPLETIYHRTSLEVLRQSALEIRFASSIFPDLASIKKYETGVVHPLINDRKLRRDFTLDSEKISCVISDDLASALSAATDDSTHSKIKIKFLKEVLHQGSVDIVRYSIDHPFMCFLNVALTFFAGGVFSMMLSEAMQGKRVGHPSPIKDLSDHVFGCPFYTPEVEDFYEEKLFAIDVFRPKGGLSTRIHVRLESELGQFFSRGLVHDEFSAWVSPGWCSRYLVPQMVARKFFSDEPIIEDFSGYKIGPA